MGLTVAEVVSEVGSELNGKRPKFARLLRDPSVATIVVEHRDRLARFGLEHLSAAMAATGRRIVVLDDAELDAELDGDLMREMTEILTSFCARLYGRRSAGRWVEAAIRAVSEAG
jgi:putative resolvase